MSLQPTLYKRTKTGAIQYWAISTDESTIRKESGQLGTTSPVVHKETAKGKNLGKANETSPTEQALLQAASDWKKKRDDGYKTLEDLGITKLIDVSNTLLIDTLEKHLPEFNTDANGNVKPMLAKAVNWDKVTYPCLVQPKLDGVRCLMIVTSRDSVVFLSRNGKEYTTLKHIGDEVWKSLNLLQVPFILDGEIYSDKISFQEITQAVKKQCPNSLKLKFRAYDIVHEDSQENRVVAHTRDRVKQINSFYVELVPYKWADCKEAVKRLHDQWVSEGNEGAMIRLPHGKYEQGQRSSSLLKVKEFNEDEFQLVQWKLGQRGTQDLLGVVITPGGTTDVTMMGSAAHKQHLYDTIDFSKKYMLTVKYFGFTDDKELRHPNGKTIRDYE